ncbi:thioredoxin fold domain-containing protein [Thiomicrorhabdus sp. Milos-T2]|uniref:thioredoxin family protein n=1 Tax=Thiomicrorhabdus sp. Milos-T2 TaxID=90814 RepID=UPI000493F9DD|nr:thioredoxin fold domain-containing protein [Thiomicrorhabdus sp. Milos-T2]
MPKKPFVYLLILAILEFMPTWVSANASYKELTNLQNLAERSKQQGLPIMLMFGAEWCDYCHLLNEEVLNPMTYNGLYEGKVVFMRHVGVDEPKPLIDWYGKPIKKDKWAYKLNADLTPTMLFFDGFGREVAPRIVGISEITLYASVIHQHINIAYKNMGLKKQIPATPEQLEIQSQATQNNLALPK